MDDQQHSEVCDGLALTLLHGPGTTLDFGTVYTVRVDIDEFEHIHYGDSAKIALAEICGGEQNKSDCGPTTHGTRTQF